MLEKSELCYCTYFLSVCVYVCHVLSCVCLFFVSFYFAFMGYVPELKVTD